MTDDTRHDGNAADNDLSELLGAYVLDALDDRERARVEERLSVDPDARAEVDRLAGAVDMVLAADVAEVTPPAGLWERIAVDLPSQPVPLAAPAGPDDELASRRARRSPARIGQALVGAAAAVAFIAVGAALVSRSAETPTSLALQLQSQAEQVAEEPGSRTAELTSDDTGATVTVVIGADGRGFVMPEDLPALRDDQTYQLWSLDSAEPISLGLLGSDPRVAVLTIGAGSETLGISVEPATGSPGPTTSPVVVGTLA